MVSTLRPARNCAVDLVRAFFDAVNPDEFRPRFAHNGHCSPERALVGPGTSPSPSFPRMRSTSSALFRGLANLLDELPIDGRSGAATPCDATQLGFGALRDPSGDSGWPWRSSTSSSPAATSDGSTRCPSGSAGGNSLLRVADRRVSPEADHRGKRVRLPSDGARERLVILRLAIAGGCGRDRVRATRGEPRFRRAPSGRAAGRSGRCAPVPASREALETRSVSYRPGIPRHGSRTGDCLAPCPYGRTAEGEPTTP